MKQPVEHHRIAACFYYPEVGWSFLARVLLLACFVSISCTSKSDDVTREHSPEEGILNAGFVCIDKVYNSELMAPYDILQHTIYRDHQNYIRCFIVTRDGRPFTTSEGIQITPHYSFANCPEIDILILPSTETSMSADLENSTLMGWLGEKIESASFVVALCDGAFPLAATGALDGRVATTFPADRGQLAKMFPEINVRHDVNFVVDGKFITSVGGALSYEPALYLVERLFSRANAERTGEGLVIDWDLKKTPHVIVVE